MSYFEKEGVSNSDLRASRLAAHGKPDSFAFQITEAMRMGTLVDALLTDRDSIDWSKMQIKGSDYKYNADEWKEAAQLEKVARTDKLYESLAPTAQTQVEIIRPLPNIEPNLIGRGKLDYLIPDIAVIDLKTTKAKNLSEWLKHFDHFDYDQQAYWYTTLANAKKCYFFVVSRPSKTCFWHSVSDEQLENGKRKALEGIKAHNFLFGGLT